MAKALRGGAVDPAGWARDAAGFAAHAARRFQRDRCLRVAASLSYTTLLALVPLATIGFAILSAFPVFEDVVTELQVIIFENLVPSSGFEMHEQFIGFMENAGKASAAGIGALAVTALLLFNTMEAAFNAIWRQQRPRPLAARLLIYWALLTMTPLLMGTSVALSSYIFTLTRMLDIEAFTGAGGRLLRLAPFVLLTMSFAVFYVILPARRVRWRHAILGAAVAALLFEGLKKGFGFYVASFPSYQAIYGALAALPFFLVWMYMAWSAVLFGAEVAASAPEWRAVKAVARGEASHSARRLGVALDMLAALAAASRGGARLARDDLPDAPGDAARPAGSVTAALADAGYLVRADDDGWVLARDLETVTLYDLYRTLGLDARALPDGIDDAEEAWRKRAAGVLAAVDAAQRDLMSVSLKELTAGGDPGGRAEARPPIEGQ